MKIIFTLFFFNIFCLSSLSLAEQRQAPFTKMSGYVVTEDNIRIAYDHYQNGHNQVIILAHGFYNSKQAVLFVQMAEDLLDRYDVLVFDFRGHGKSKGFFDWTAKESRDLTAVLEYVHAYPQYKNTGVIGFSLGAATSILTAVETDLIDSLILVSPPADFDEIDKHFWKPAVWEQIIYNTLQDGRIGKGVKPGKLWLEKTKPIDVIEKLSCPVLFIHGKKDWLILPWHTEALYKKAKGNKRMKIFEKGTHAEFIYRRFPEEMHQLFEDWFAETLQH